MDVAIDMGGTFTDAVARRVDGTWVVGKAATTPGEYQKGFLAALATVAPDIDGISSLTHGTTVVLNALLTADRPDAALITTAGFKDVLEIMRADRKELFNLEQAKPTPLVPRSRRLEVTERIGSHGEVVEPLTQESIDAVLDALEGTGCNSVAVCLLFSFRNPDHERQLGAAIRRRFPDIYVSLSHEVLPIYREFERTSTTVVNAVGRPLMDDYLGRLESTLPTELVSKSFQVMDSSGGLVDPVQARDVPVRTLFSGPAGGVVLGIEIGQTLGRGNVISFDMGGTSTDVAAVTAGDPDRSTYLELAGYPVQIPCLDIATVGAGGGSIGWLDDGGALLAGPRSAGALPGPACYGKGGTEPTVTDAAVALGRYNPVAAIGGGLTIDRDKAWAAIHSLAERVGLSDEATAWGIIRLVNSNMANAIRGVSIERSRDPRDYSLVAMGGGGPAHGLEIAQDLGLESVIVPAYPGVASAQGMLLADMRRERLVTLYATLSDTNPEHLRDVIAQLMKQARDDFHMELDEARLVAIATIDLRYRGQTHELSIGVEATAPDIVDAAVKFHAAHRARYGHHVPDADIELVNARVALVLLSTSKEFGEPTWPSIDSLAPRETYWGPEHGWLMTPVYTREFAEVSGILTGPAIIEQTDTTIIIPPGAECSALRPGFLELKWSKS